MHRMLAVAALAAASLTHGLSHAQPWRCTVAGKTVYQDTPCVDGRSVKTDTNTIGASVDRAELERLQQQRLVASGTLQVGMLEASVYRLLGQPSRVNESVYAHGTSKQIIFEGDHGTTYVYTRAGVVTSFSHSPAIHAGRNRAESCPGDVELRQADVRASAITSPPEERERWRRVADEIRRCRK